MSDYGRKAVGSSLVLATANAVLGGLVSGGAKTAEALGAESLSDHVVSAAKSPLTYLSIIAFGQVLNLGKWAHNRYTQNHL